MISTSLRICDYTSVLGICRVVQGSSVEGQRSECLGEGIADCNTSMEMEFFVSLGECTVVFLLCSKVKKPKSTLA